MACPYCGSIAKYCYFLMGVFESEAIKTRRPQAFLLWPSLLILKIINCNLFGFRNSSICVGVLVITAEHDLFRPVMQQPDQRIKVFCG